MMRVVLVSLVIAVAMEGAALAWRQHARHGGVHPIGVVSGDGPAVACRRGQTIVTVGCDH